MLIEYSMSHRASEGCCAIETGGAGIIAMGVNAVLYRHATKPTAATAK